MTCRCRGWGQRWRWALGGDRGDWVWFGWSGRGEGWGGWKGECCNDRLDEDRSTKKPPLTQPDPDEAQSSLRRDCMPRQKHLSSVFHAAARADKFHRHRNLDVDTARSALGQTSETRFKARVTSRLTHNNERDGKNEVP